jgi:hypothetical protein
MNRLLDGRPLHSDGKLTVKALAEEARVKRWLLTHRHTDLQAEFRARVAHTDGAPAAIRALQDANEAGKDRIRELTADVTAHKATIRQLERIIQVLALENDQFRARSVKRSPTTLAAARPIEDHL